MSINHIRQSMEDVIKFYRAHPEKAVSTDKAAVAVMQEGLLCRAEGPNGAVLVSDMPAGVGGGGTAPTPGWFMRAALANCDATLIAMRAAQLGIALEALEVAVDSESDDRGLLGVVDDIPAGPLGMRIRVRICAGGVAPGLLRDIVQWAEAHSPVGDALRRAISCNTELELG